MKTFSKIAAGISILYALATPVKSQVNDFNAESIKSFEKNSSYLRLNGDFKLPLDFKANGFVELYPDDFAFGKGFYSKLNLDKKILGTDLGDISARTQLVTGTDAADIFGLGINYSKAFDNAFVSAYWLPFWNDTRLSHQGNNNIIGFYASDDLLGVKLSGFGYVNLSGTKGVEWGYGEIDVERPLTDNLSIAYNPTLRDIGKLSPKLEHRITLKYDFENNTVEDPKIDGFVKTEDDIQDTQDRKGVALHRTELSVGPLRFKYDAMTNLSHADNLKNVSGIYLDKIVDQKDVKSWACLLSIGNHDGKDETFADIGSKVISDETSYILDLGSSVRQTSIPRKYFIATAQDVPLLGQFKATADASILTKDPLQNEGAARFYGWIGAYNDNAFLSYGNEIHNKHVFAGITGFKDFGYLGWYKKFADGTWFIKNRLAEGQVDDKYYSTANMIFSTRTFVVPSFFGTHLSPSQTRGDITLGFDMNGNKDNTTMTIKPGVSTPVGQFALGTDTKFQNNQSTTGLYASYYNNISVAGANFRAELDYSGLTKSANAYIWMRVDI